MRNRILQIAILAALYAMWAASLSAQEIPTDQDDDDCEDENVRIIVRDIALGLQIQDRSRIDDARHRPDRTRDRVDDDGDPLDDVFFRYPTHFFSGYQGMGGAAGGYFMGWQGYIYPGVELAHYGDEYCLEYVFVLRLGSDPSRIMLEHHYTDGMRMLPGSDVHYDLDRGEMIQYRPQIYYQSHEPPRESRAAVYYTRRVPVVEETPDVFDVQPILWSVTNRAGISTSAVCWGDCDFTNETHALRNRDDGPRDDTNRYSILGYGTVEGIDPFITIRSNRYGQISYNIWRQPELEGKLETVSWAGRYIPVGHNSTRIAPDAQLAYYRRLDRKSLEPPDDIENTCDELRESRPTAYSEIERACSRLFPDGGRPYEECLADACAAQDPDDAVLARSTAVLEALTRGRLVPRGGQLEGPAYDFYMSAYETTTDQYLQFLNDAQANSNTLRGAHTYFDSEGNVWFNPAMRRDRQELFKVQDSGLVYDPEQPPGRRYSHFQVEDEEGDKETPYTNHPIVNVSWYGSIKYCNWLTLASGQGPEERAYFEGTNSVDWRPVTATNWSLGRFGDAERSLLLAFRGFRLPMLDSYASRIVTNDFNEIYKAAAWQGRTNRVFGFGRDEGDYRDGNSREASDIHGGHTLPVGFFDGNQTLTNRMFQTPDIADHPDYADDEDDEYRVHAEENLYGLYDLSGNVSEWLTDHGRPGDRRSRAVVGGSWKYPIRESIFGEARPPHYLADDLGFRVGGVYLGDLDDLVRVHVLYCFYLEPCGAKEPELAEKEEEEELEKYPPVEEGGGLTVEVRTVPGDAENILILQPLPPTPPTPHRRHHRPIDAPEPPFVPPPVKETPTSPPGGGDDDDDDDPAP